MKKDTLWLGCFIAAPLWLLLGAQMSGFAQVFDASVGLSFGIASMLIPLLKD